MIYVCGGSVGTEKDFARTWCAFDTPDDTACNTIDDVNKVGAPSGYPDCPVVCAEKPLMRGTIHICLRYNTIV